jgi:aspartyl-tRNA(Asn)/glutamyl-tRNA(Gln) amidotransferase subunit A
MAMGSSLDQIGPITKTVTDAEIVFRAISGIDPKDSTTVDLSKFIEKKPKNKKSVIGVPRHFLTGDGIDPGVMSAFEASLKKLEGMGYEVREIKLPNISYSLMAYYIVMPAEVSANMARFDGVKYGLHVPGKDIIDDYFETRRAGLGREVKRRILLGTYVLSSGYYDAYYNRANALRRMITDDFDRAFETVDIVATPTAPSPAFLIGEKNNDPISMYLEDIFTVTANLTGMPAMSVPMGTVEKGGKSLPTGMQFSTRLGGEDILFAVGKDFLGENHES